jgi:GntR family transcriptional regulator, transcriptional repressor for pyruvate dehydrogenase complex
VAVEVLAFAPVRERRTFEAIVGQLAEAVRTGELRSGDRLPSERLLAAQMEVSRPTLREAIKVLADSGVVRVRPGAGGGTFVISNTIPAELVVRTGARVDEVPAVLEARRVFEPQVAQLAARVGTERGFRVLGRIVEQQEAALDDWARITQLDTRFHLELARATQNPLVVSLMTVLSRHLTIARATRMDERVPVEKAVAANRALFSVVRGRDEQAVLRAMDEHLRLLEEAWFDAT